MSDKGFGHLLVALQMGLLGALLALAAPAVLGGRWSPAAAVLALGGLLLGGWALACNRPGNFNIHPAPRTGATLVRQGPYRWIRHPMYTAVLLVGAACAAAAGLHWPAWAAWAALLAVLLAKARLEERWLLRVHADYAGYRARSARFLPGLY